MPTPITVSANFIDLTGSTVQGYMVAAIVSPTGVNDLYVSGLGIISPKSQTSTIGSTVSVNVWGNDVVVDLADNSKDTYYTVTLYNTLNQVVFTANYFFTGSGPINLVGFSPIIILPPPPTFSQPPIGQLPGGASGNVQYNNAGIFGGDSTFTFNAGTKVVTGTIFNATTGFQVGGAAANGQVLVGNGTNFVSGTVPWSSLGNALSALTLSNGTFATTFNQSSSVAWTWANITLATNTVAQSSPTLKLSGQAWNGSSSYTDTWTIGPIISNGSSATSDLTISYTAGTSTPTLSILGPNNCQIGFDNLQDITLTSGNNVGGTALTLFNGHNVGIINTYSISMDPGPTGFGGLLLTHNTATASAMLWDNTTGYLYLRSASAAGIVGIGAGSSGSPAVLLLPTATGSSGQFLSTNGASPQQLSWVTGVQEICSGQIALTTGAIASGTRATNTLTCTGLSTSTDSISCAFSGDTNAVTGYAPSASGSLALKTWVSANTINVDQINNTSGSITPGAATITCKGIR